MAKRSQISKLRQQQAVTAVLARPRWIQKKWKPKTKVTTGVRKSALKGQCTSLVNFLAQPLPRQYRTIADLRQVETKIPPVALKAKPRPWNIRSALPKLKNVRRTKALFYTRLGKRQRKALDATLHQVMDVYNENHPAEGVQNDTILFGSIVHKKCCNDSVVKRGKKICELGRKGRILFRDRMLSLGRPKPKRVPPKPDRGKKKPLKELRVRLADLTIPRHRYEGPPPDPFEIKPSALKAVCSPWLEQLARHREERPPAPVYDFRGNEILPPHEWDIAARRRVVASERTMELAVPKRVKKKLVNDLKEDPFRVNPKALNYICTERIAKLAQPIQR